jgi:hypothetical protein
MPLARYFFFIGGILLALLFAVDAMVPTLSENAASSRSKDSASADGPDKSIIRIHSDRKWPERVVFDTSLPTIVPVSVAKTETVSPASAEASPKARVREAFAQFTPSESKKPEAKPPRKRRIAKARVAPPTILVAQQPRFGLFETTW